MMPLRRPHQRRFYTIILCALPLCSDIERDNWLYAYCINMMIEMGWLVYAVYALVLLLRNRGFMVEYFKIMIM